MKASLKFQEEHQKPPILRVKIPLNILGFPFQSGVSTVGLDSKDLILNLSTFFDSGPSLKLVYKPNDSWNPFSLVVKTGIGPFGSPISAPLSMSAEFNLLSRGNPSFFLRFHPKFGDFSLKKNTGSQNIVKSFKKSDIGSEKPLDNGIANGYGLFERVNSNAVSNMVDGVFNGVEVKARTTLPIRNQAVLKFNWGFRMPDDDVVRNPTGGINFRKLPFLVMNKISIEHVTGEDSKKRDADLAKEADEAGFGVKRQLDVLHAENGFLRRAVEDLRLEIGAGQKCGNERKAAEFFAGKVADGNLNEGKKDLIVTGV